MIENKTCDINTTLAIYTVEIHKKDTRLRDC